MAIERNDEHLYIDNTAKAQRVTVVSGGGGGAVQRVTSIQRVNTATTTPIAAGTQSYTVTVVTASGAASPTLDGVALPAGYTATYAVTNPGDTLEAASMVTATGDDVIILKVT